MWEIGRLVGEFNAAEDVNMHRVHKSSFLVLLIIKDLILFVIFPSYNKIQFFFYFCDEYTINKIGAMDKNVS